MKYKSPQVEDYPETEDATPSIPPKRKFDQRDLSDESGAGQASADVEREGDQPPSKVVKKDARKGDGAEEEMIEGVAGEEDDDGYDGQVESLDDEEDEDGALEQDDEGDELEEEEEEEEADQEKDESEEPTPEEPQSPTTISKPKLQKAVHDYGCLPLYGTTIAKGTLHSSPETLLAMVIDAMLKSRPISHDLSQRAVNHLIEVGFHDIRKLSESSWEERAMALKDGGYNRYREQGATNLGEMVELINDKYEGDLNNLLKKANNDRKKTRQLIKEIKGLGDLGADLFLNNVQSVWPSMAPFLDGRSLETADKVGLGTDLEAIYAELGRDCVSMSRLANGLSNVRLERKQGDIMAS
ncbi:hypothetical protein ASPACDRAFT_79530 [Aspergillus aculeatus ATCC 16872]|uniref:HhH-GPD domain-containing protein n=1 Tax=Aspergillus aculeatus (strain ATCC 16872 / CBS 172.66 / WB 5094) TaxID=690307 RepID=A0A1L9WRA2_ASPA1|nr:uncharacterized protein ASPACDRAFT_79530 [Aspergillus aculeatus ATCC 16872]OJJ98725.1 hypothetical protein ASPACDRAFT_79530 [Aspergillus aculeatus ATCC 16872]